MNLLKRFYYGGILSELIAIAIIFCCPIKGFAIPTLGLFLLGAISSLVAGVVLICQNLKHWPYPIFSLALFVACIYPKF